MAIAGFVFGLIVDWKIFFYPNFVQTTGLAGEDEKLRLEASLKGFVDFCNQVSTSVEADIGGRKPLPFEHLLAHRPRPAVLESIARLGEIAPSLEPIIEKLGNTRLIELPSPKEDIRIFGKCEWNNPFGSVKDRTAFALLARLIDEHPEILTTGGEIVEYSGGNLGVALANIAKHLNLPLTVFLSSKSSNDIVDAIESLGGRVRKVPPGGGFFAVMKEAFEYVSQNANSYLLYQHVNRYNPLVHELSTGVEISNSLNEMKVEGAINLIASVGTGGTLVGTARALQKHFPEVGIYALSPSELIYGSDAPPNDDPKLAGSGGFGCGLKQPFVHAIESTITDYVSVSYEEALEAGASLIVRINEAVSSSGAAAWLSAYRLAERSSQPESYVVILPSRPTASEFEKMQAVAFKETAHQIAQTSAGVS
ncbi:pyridoxal-phosphate dependent enzyme [Agrobacterium radiobacter]|uniref:pyridoxal-phosphate dependent enzyme n=1 Tax=Agrobacterium radiobacter TaxID=362 RepID=UPI003F852E26